MTSALWLDRAGGAASAACAAHCLAMMAAPALISSTGLGFLQSEAFEWGFFALALGFGGAAATLGYRVHGTVWLAAGFGVGMLLLAAGRLGEALSLFEGAGMVAITGGVTLVGAHLASIQCTQACQGVLAS